MATGRLCGPPTRRLSDGQTSPCSKVGGCHAHLKLKRNGAHWAQSYSFQFFQEQLLTDCCSDRRALADPTVWLDNKGNFHVFSHAYVPVDVLAPYRYADVVGGEHFYRRLFLARQSFQHMT